MEQENIYVTEYSISLRLPEEHEDRFDKGIHVYDFPAELIGNEGFIDKIIEIDKEGKKVINK